MKVTTRIEWMTDPDTNNPVPVPEWMNCDQVARYIQLKGNEKQRRRTLRRLREQGLKYSLVQNAPRYRKEDVDKFMETRVGQPGSRTWKKE